MVPGRGSMGVGRVGAAGTCGGCMHAGAVHVVAVHVVARMGTRGHAAGPFRGVQMLAMPRNGSHQEQEHQEEARGPPPPGGEKSVHRRYLKMRSRSSSRMASAAWPPSRSASAAQWARWFRMISRLTPRRASWMDATCTRMSGQ